MRLSDKLLDGRQGNHAHDRAAQAAGGFLTFLTYAAAPVMAAGLVALGYIIGVVAS